jgi:hypothetical protein
MSLLIHATVTVTGDKALLDACDARIRQLLDEQVVDGEVAEQHGEETLCYDLMVKGGIPFPAFAAASREFPALTIEVQWVDAGAGAKGTVTIANGRAIEHRIEKL